MFEDLLCQLHDMLVPESEGAYTIRDLRRTRPNSALLFNALFNLQKFLGFEHRDPFAQRAEAGEFAGMSDWDKFAKIEYFRLASEDDQGDGDGAVGESEEDVWGSFDGDGLR
jgi:serine/threonine-protein phosphatase 2A regulatory subunit B''